MKKRRIINEALIAGAMFGLPGGYDNTMSPASYMVQGPYPGYTYNMLAFNDTLQQPKNKLSNEHIIHAGDLVRGKGSNNPDKTYTGVVRWIAKNGKSEVVCLYIQTLKNSRIVSIRPEGVEWLVSRKPPQYGGYKLSPSNDLDIGKGTMRGTY